MRHKTKTKIILKIDFFDINNSSHKIDIFITTRLYHKGLGLTFDISIFDRIQIAIDKIYSYFGQVKPNLVKYILICELKFEGWECHGYKGS
ncbi:hypothetical protein C3E88_07160 [Clostridium sp. Cult3]|nr:hypothetical protein [Clostridium sp. Cult3]